MWWLLGPSSRIICPYPLRASAPIRTRVPKIEKISAKAPAIRICLNFQLRSCLTTSSLASEPKLQNLRNEKLLLKLHLLQRSDLSWIGTHQYLRNGEFPYLLTSLLIPEHQSQPNDQFRAPEQGCQSPREVKCLTRRVHAFFRGKPRTGHHVPAQKEPEIAGPPT